MLQRVTSHANGKYRFACVTSVITNNILRALNKTNDRFSADEMPRQHGKSKTEVNFPSTSCVRLCSIADTLLSVRSAPKNQNTNNVVRGMAHRNGERVALGALIGLFRAEGRKGSPIVRGYLHTNSIMVIRDAPLEALEVSRALWCFRPDYILR